MTWVRAAFIGAVILLIGGTIVSAFTATNAVPSTRAGVVTDAVTSLKLRPSDCSSVAVVALVTGSGSFAGTKSNELVLGSADVDSISGGGGDDCVMGGGGNDTVGGGQDVDVCIGGPGTDTFNSCETVIQ